MSLTLFDNIETDLTQNLESKTEDFLNLIKSYSIENPLKSKAIENILHIKGSEVRSLVRYCRRMEYPVGSSGKGYFWIKNNEELEKTIRHLVERKQSLETTIREMQHIRLYIKQNPQQTAI